MNINHKFSTEFKFPFIKYSYTERDQNYIDTDLFFTPVVSINGLMLKVTIVYHELLVTRERLVVAKAKDRHFYEDSHEVKLSKVAINSL